MHLNISNTSAQGKIDFTEHMLTNNGACCHNGTTYTGVNTQNNHETPQIVKLTQKN